MRVFISVLFCFCFALVVYGESESNSSEMESQLVDKLPWDKPSDIDFDADELTEEEEEYFYFYPNDLIAVYNSGGISEGVEDASSFLNSVIEEAYQDGLIPTDVSIELVDTNEDGQGDAVLSCPCHFTTSFSG